MPSKFFRTLVSGFVFVAGFAWAQAPALQPVAFASVTSVTPLANGVELRDGSLVLRITALRDDIVRLRGGRAALPEDASWAVLREARTASIAVTPENSASSAGFRTASLRVRVDRATGLLTVSDSAGRLLRQDTAPLTFRANGFELASAMPADEHYFGLGDKTGPFDRREQAFRLWNTDAYAWQESTDPLYKAIPFYMSYRAGTTLGTLIDNTWPASFDFGKTLTDTVQYRAEGGGLDMYLLAGPSAKHVLASYAWLTGPTPLPPLWALGYQQSRYSYMTQDRVLDVAARLRADHIPADAIYLDIDYQLKNRPFTFDRVAFPDPGGMVAKLHAEQMHVVAITDLHIARVANKGYAPYDSGTAGHHFVSKRDGTDYVGPVWPGPSVFPDFTRQQTRAWWGSLYAAMVRLGIDGFWNDMNEPSVFTGLKTIPGDAVHRIDEPGFATRTATHTELHNVYGMENARATFEGQLALRPGVRPFVLTRAAYAGSQRYAATWTGDNSATWNHLRLTTSMLKNLGLSGYSLAGADVGGYAGTPSAELLTKWMELAAFQPIDRSHAEKDTGDHEPWSNGAEQEAIRRRFVETRYRLLPYLYTTMESNTHTGLPLLRPLFLEFPDAAPDHHPLDVDAGTSAEFLAGADLLIAPPPMAERPDAYDAKLPSAGWYDFWTGKQVEAAKTRVPAAGEQPEAESEAAQAAGVPKSSIASVRIEPRLETLPVFVRPGAILPVAPLTQSTSETPQGPLTLRVFPGPDCRGAVYQDDGSSYAFLRGESVRMEFSCTATASGLTVHIGRHEGRYKPWWQELAVEINGLRRELTAATVDGRKLVLDGSNTIRIPDTGRGSELVVR